MESTPTRKAMPVSAKSEVKKSESTKPKLTQEQLDMQKYLGMDSVQDIAKKPAD